MTRPFDVAIGVLKDAAKYNGRLVLKYSAGLDHQAEAFHKEIVASYQAAIRALEAAGNLKPGERLAIVYGSIVCGNGLARYIDTALPDGEKK